MKDLIEVIKSALRKKAVAFKTGGIRPTFQMGESWIGRVAWQNPGEEQPIGRRGYPMVPMATIFVPDSDYVPKVLRNIKLITIFMDDAWWDNISANDYKDFFLIRTYESLDQLVPCDYTSKEQLLFFPLVPQFVDNEFPNWEDISDRNLVQVILELENKKKLDYYNDIHEDNKRVHKLGGYPSSIQGEVLFDEGYEFVMQIASDPKADINIVDNGNFYFAYNPNKKDWSIKCDFY